MIIVCTQTQAFIYTAFQFLTLLLPCAHDDVERTVREIANFAKNSNSLIVLDDCASSKNVKNRTSELVKLGFHGRHIGLSTIVITQQLTSITKPYRMNISKLVRYVLQRVQGRYEIYFYNYLSAEKDEEKNYRHVKK